MIKTIFFDLDDTLLDFHRSEREAITQTLSSFGIDPTDAVRERYSAINKYVWKQLELGLMTREQILVKRFELLFEELGVDADGMAVKRAYEWNLGGSYFYLDGAEELLEELQKKYDLYIMSNGTAVVQDRRIAASGIDKYFKEIFISEKVGYNKPSIEFFERCFERIPDFDKSSAIIIGDALTSDIKGGINAGILTCHYNPRAEGYEDIIPDYTIKTLEELPALLESI